MPPPDDLEARRRQALQQIGKSIRELMEFELTLLANSPAPEPLPWTVERVRDIRRGMDTAYDLLSNLIKPKDLLDEMADL